MHVSEPKLTKRSRPTESTGHTQRHTLGTINNRRNTHQAMIKVDIIRKRKRITRRPMNRLGHRGSCNKTLDEQAEIHVAKQMKQKKTHVAWTTRKDPHKQLIERKKSSPTVPTSTQKNYAHLTAASTTNIIHREEAETHQIPRRRAEQQA